MFKLTSRQCLIIWPQFDLNLTSIYDEMTSLGKFILKLRTLQVHFIAFLICVLVFKFFDPKIFRKFLPRILAFFKEKWVCELTYIRYVITKVVRKSKTGILVRTGTDRFEPSRLFKITNLILWKSLIVSDAGILGFRDFKNDKNSFSESHVPYIKRFCFLTYKFCVIFSRKCLESDIRFRTSMKWP